MTVSAQTGETQEQASGTAALLDVLVVGAGFSGICAGVKLQEAGVYDFLIVEKAEDFGGTWWHNTYPGCAVDVTSPMYSFSFAQKSDWSNLFAPQPELLAYARQVAKDFNLRPRTRFGVAVEQLVFDESADRWDVSLSDGSVYRARVVIGGFGGLHVPKIPEFAGLSTFQGPVFHSAQWRHDVDLQGKKVVVIGTGASAVQFVPEVAKEAERLTVFMRSPHWVLPRLDYSIKPWQHAVLKHVPGARRLLRAIAYFLYEGFVFNLFFPKVFARFFEAASKAHMRRQIADPALRQLLTPDWRFGCKRVVMSSTYYPALQRPNVTLEHSGVAEFTEHGVRSADGVLHEADVVILGTGFETTEGVLHLPIIGRGGTSLADAWHTDGPEQFLGLSTHGFPNLFTLVGLNTTGGNQSVIFAIEAQMHYINQAIRWIFGSRSGVTRVELRESVQRRYNRDVQKKLKKSVWLTGGCKSWYLDSEGRNAIAWPGFSFGLWCKTRFAKASDWELSGVQSRQIAEGYTGPAEIVLVGESIPVEAEVRGHIDPLDGARPWYGRVVGGPSLGVLAASGDTTATLQIPGREAASVRLAGQDARGGFRVVGVGAPPFALGPAALERSG
ncbi:fumarate reductase/succinate dehydrogenase flavoprotein domain protein [Segniliparus rotundus DSM 44985]|uniref:Fumarate reductase/succinate dehydrogenase flavoprotein domain protein n=1 Tax=Segniliparus rotundus (strain ATCC BAA-972 / CDC 1076 / CIP 108378 / DSM 44985 / JCM 13578) TaxID=640132 RepID=D6ZA78_SEGRD|nr:DUF4873 domain-containing protein [Segniliparus rotundus]ADG96620.1 fumarate reductase/succinate dehydrogenase flavoprotein domain protein [Segniliparus rotundus DSM 44985]